MAGSETVIEIRQLSSLAEFEEAVEIERAVWQFSDRELLSSRFFVVANKIGGHLFGAYHGHQMVGFCLGIPGLKPDGRSYLHSHMLGVLPAYRDTGVGRRLKLRQREYALARNFDLIEWTFSPLEVRNAFFNIERLGAIVRHYVENQYGDSSSPLDGGLPTDRCVAEWWIRSPRVQSILAGKTISHSVAERIAVPADIDRIRRDDPNRAREIQRSNAARFEACFARGLAVQGFEPRTEESVYLLEPWE